MKRLFAGVLSTAMALSLAACSNKTGNAPAGNGALKDGTYTASVMGMNDMVEVTATVSGGKLTAAEVTSDSETPGIGGVLKNKADEVVVSGGKAPTQLIPELVVENQTLAVDNVTGATITSFAVKSALEDCLKQAGANLDDWKTEYHREAVGDQEADIVIIGGGGAGLAAAVTAAQQGKKVVILEKAGEIGGDTLVCGAIYNTPDEALQSQVEMTDTVKATIEKALAMTSDDAEKQAALAEMQAPVKEQWDAYKAAGRTDLFDSKEWYALQTWINGDMVANPELVKVLTYNSFAGYEWIESLGMEFLDSVSQGAGSLWQRTHTSKMNMGTGFISTYADQLEKYKDQITVITEATVTDLQMEGDRVIGAVAKDNHNDTTFKATASDGVILASGGFSANGALVQEYNTTGKWPDLSKAGTTNRASSSMGDGIALARQADASLTDMEQIQLLYLGNVVDGQISKLTRRDISGTDQVIFINKSGERFVREDGRRDEICTAVLNQEDQMFYVLESGDGAGYKDIKDPEWTSSDGFSFDYLNDNGFIIWDETLEGLAGKLGCDAATLQATVDAFNASVESGEDTFGRTLYSTKLENGPWVVCARQACIHHTMGGVTIDAAGHVLNESGTAISGLYAAGEVVGGIHGGNRLGGNAVVDTVVFGKLAGDTVVADSAN